MRNTAREPRKSQQGLSLLIVLIVLATGTLAIPATLNYVSTGVKAAKISENQLQVNNFQNPIGDQLAPERRGLRHQLA